MHVNNTKRFVLFTCMYREKFHSYFITCFANDGDFIYYFLFIILFIFNE